MRPQICQAVGDKEHGTQERFKFSLGIDSQIFTWFSYCVHVPYIARKTTPTLSTGARPERMLLMTTSGSDFKKVMCKIDQEFCKWQQLSKNIMN